jgi:hypothetical protein
MNLPGLGDCRDSKSIKANKLSRRRPAMTVRKIALAATVQQPCQWQLLYCRSSKPHKTGIPEQKLTYTSPTSHNRNAAFCPPPPATELSTDSSFRYRNANNFESSTTRNYGMTTPPHRSLSPRCNNLLVVLHSLLHASRNGVSNRYSSSSLSTVLLGY